MRAICFWRPPMAGTIPKRCAARKSGSKFVSRGPYTPGGRMMVTGRRRGFQNEAFGGTLAFAIEIMRTRFGAFIHRRGRGIRPDRRHAGDIDKSLHAGRNGLEKPTGTLGIGGAVLGGGAGG